MASHVGLRRAQKPDSSSSTGGWSSPGAAAALLPSGARVFPFLVVHKIGNLWYWIFCLGRSFWMMEGRAEAWHPSMDAQAVEGQHG